MPWPATPKVRGSGVAVISTRHFAGVVVAVVDVGAGLKHASGEIGEPSPRVPGRCFENGVGHVLARRSIAPCTFRAKARERKIDIAHWPETLPTVKSSGRWTSRSVVGKDVRIAVKKSAVGPVPEKRPTKGSNPPDGITAPAALVPPPKP